MGKGLARLIGSGIGFTSEAIQAARHKKTDSTSVTTTDTPRYLTSAETEDRYVGADSERADENIDRGIAELSEDSKLPGYLELPADQESPHFSSEERREINAAVSGYESDGERIPSVYTKDDVKRSMDEDEAAWQLDEAAEQWGLPTYDEAERVPGDAAAAQSHSQENPENDYAPINENDSEETKEKKRDAMVRALVQMAGPPGPVRRLPCPVIIPQRRPGAKKRGFVRAYAPVLADCGISQDVFIKFISDFHKASQASLWLQVVVVASHVTGFSPSLAVALTATAIQIVAETAMQFQIRHRTNSYLDKVNEEVFMPRGQYALIMKFKDHGPSQKQESSSSFSDMLGGLFSTEKVDLNQSDVKAQDPSSTQPTKSNILEFNAAATISKFTHSEEHPEMTAWTKRMKHYRDVSGRTRGELELPECAPLIFPDIDRAAMRVREGKEPKSKFQSGRTWVRDYIDRKSQAEFESEHRGSALAVPETGRKAFTSRYNDPSHPANNGKLLSALTGGLYNPKPGLIERAGMAIKESQDKKRAAQGLPPSEPWKDKLRRKKKEQAGRLKILQEDVMYLMIVNMPTEEELKQSVAELRHLMETEGRTLPPGHSRR